MVEEMAVVNIHAFLAAAAKANVFECQVADLGDMLVVFHVDAIATARLAVSRQRGGGSGSEVGCTFYDEAWK